MVQIAESKIMIMFVCRCNGHAPATDSHRRVGAAQTWARRL